MESILMCNRKRYGSRLRWLIVVPAVFVLGCSAPAQSLKGDGKRPTGADQAALAGAFQSKRIAVVIGINSYRDPKWNPLAYAVKDAEDIAAVLRDPNSGRFDRVTVLSSPEETARENILQAVRRVARENLSPADTVVLYISSHGTLGRIKDGHLRQYVVTHDTDPGAVASTAIDLDELKKEFNQLRSQKKVLILAFCHSGQGKSQLDESMQSELKTLKAPFFVKPIESASEATVVLTASAWGETAREDRNLENDIYTHFLIEGIKGEDRNGDGAVTVTEAHDYAREKTYYYTQGQQRPSIESVILGTDPIVMAGTVIRSAKPVLYDYSQRFQGVHVVIDGQEKGTLPSGVAVEPGKRHVVLLPDGGAEPIYDDQVNVRTGQQLSIPVLILGHDQNLAVRLGYQGFLTEEINNSVSKPLMTYGLVYNHHTLFTPRLGFRADFSYGRDRQTLEAGATTAEADVSQTSVGAALLYRYQTKWVSLYAGPR
ncbi:MAG TPA: caspase family protein, partial [Nitrospiria bacterium]